MNRRRFLLEIISQKNYDFLPSAYQRVEYIESNGTQYINTGYDLTTSTSAELDIYFNPSVNNDKRIISYERSGDYIFDIYYERSSIGNSIRFRSGRPLVQQTFSLTTPQRLVVKNENKNNTMYAYVNGTQIGSSTIYGQNLLASNSKLFIFARNDGYTPATAFGSFKLYSCKIYNNGNLMRNFIPCYRKADNEIGLYDGVSKVFYTNAGTGTFTKGQDVL